MLVGAEKNRELDGRERTDFGCSVEPTNEVRRNLALRDVRSGPQITKLEVIFRFVNLYSTRIN